MHSAQLGLWFAPFHGLLVEKEYSTCTTRMRLQEGVPFGELESVLWVSGQWPRVRLDCDVVEPKEGGWIAIYSREEARH